MSYEIIARKVISGTTFKKLSTNVATFIAENISELTLMRTNNTTNGYGTGNYLSFDETKAGICVYGCDASNITNSTSSYLCFSSAGNITSTSGKVAHPSNTSVLYNQAWMTTAGTYFTNQNTVLYVNCEVTIAKLSSGYLLSFGGCAIYISYYTSPVAGKKIICINLNADTSSNSSASYCGYKGFSVIGESWNSSYNNYNSCYYNFSCIYSEDGSEYHCAQGTTFAPSSNAVDNYTAILSPMYVVCSDIWIEPILLPDIYYMSASNYPGLYEEAQVGDVTVFRMTGNGYIVVV